MAQSITLVVTETVTSSIELTAEELEELGYPTDPQELADFLDEKDVDDVFADIESDLSFDFAEDRTITVSSI